MDPNNKIEDLEILTDETEPSGSVDDFIRQLEAREKDLHITSDTTIIEIADSFEDGELPELLAPDVEKARAASVSGAVGNGVAADLEMEVQRLRSAIEKMESEREEIFKNSQRRAKDFESYKARTERERTDTFQNQVGNLATFLLPALDNFNRAIASAEQLKEQKGVEFQQFYEGVTLVNEQMYDILGKMGIRVIPTVGEPFDPNYHEAVAIEEREDYPDSYICEELARGFRIGDRVIRHSMVKVVKNNLPAETSITSDDLETLSIEPSESVEN
jgi:molecular chaperone GrpE